MSLTMRQMCEIIEKSNILVLDNGESPTAVQIFNYSPSGELFEIFSWYALAKQVDEASTNQGKDS